MNQFLFAVLTSMVLVQPTMGSPVSATTVIPPVSKVNYGDVLVLPGYGVYRVEHWPGKSRSDETSYFLTPYYPEFGQREMWTDKKEHELRGPVSRERAAAVLESFLKGPQKKYKYGPQEAADLKWTMSPEELAGYLQGLWQLPDKKIKRGSALDQMKASFTIWLISELALATKKTPQEILPQLGLEKHYQTVGQIVEKTPIR